MAFITLRRNTLIFAFFIFIMIVSVIVFAIFFKSDKPNENTVIPNQNHTEKPNSQATIPKEKSNTDYIKWVEFNPTYKALKEAMNADIKSQETETPVDWIQLLAYLGAKYGGDFSRYKTSDLNSLLKRISDGDSIENITADMKYYKYYYKAYDAVLSNYVGTYTKQTKDENGNITWKTKYGLRVYSPIAEGYSYNHYDDFGNSRSYGFARKHLGHDMMGSIGTPIVAIEGGYIECMGWNQYGGWRIGIRSFDKKRYYYYAHLRKDHPYQSNLKEGDEVKPGEVIGYLGMTGYSTKENVNNINVPHLHLGIQLIFDESQKESNNEIWIDCYNLVKLLAENKSTVARNENGEYFRVYDIEIHEE